MSAPGPSAKRNLWEPYKEGQEDLFLTLASGLHAFAGHVADAVIAKAPEPSGRPDRPVPYKRTITYSTYLRGQVFAGSDVRNVPDQRRQIYSLVYTTSRLGHFLEFGTKPHPMTKMLMHGRIATVAWMHPGAKRRPHFVAGLLEARARFPEMMMKGSRTRQIKINTRARVTPYVKP